MRLAIDGKFIDLDESVDRIVIERSASGVLTISSSFGIKRQVITPRASVAVRDEVENFSGPLHENGNSVRQSIPMGALGVAEAKTTKTRRAAPTVTGKVCRACNKRQGTRAFRCISCGVPFPGHE